jgi:hypothetical protein
MVSENNRTKPFHWLTIPETSFHYLTKKCLTNCEFTLLYYCPAYVSVVQGYCENTMFIAIGLCSITKLTENVSETLSDFD